MQKQKKELCMPVNRRQFLQQSALASGAIIASASGVNANTFTTTKDSDTISILHTNDVHSRLEPFPMDGSKNAGLGGVATRAAIINQIRLETDNVLLLDAGDIFEGTPYFNLYKGEPEMKAMSRMQYDAATMGNHDFAAGIDNFAFQLQHASFPILLCNYDFSNTAMANKHLPYKIFDKKGIKVGVTGVGIELQGLVADNLYGNTIYKDPIESVNATTKILKQAGCDMIICLSHLGDKYDDNKVSDEVLAKNCYDIDLIIGGHTHRFFSEPRKYTNKSGGDTLVNQVGWGGLSLGRLDYKFEGRKNKKLMKAHTALVEIKTRE
jgi:5'-nucleotidase